MLLLYTYHLWKEHVFTYVKDGTEKQHTIFWFGNVCTCRLRMLQPVRSFARPTLPAPSGCSKTTRRWPKECALFRWSGTEKRKTWLQDLQTADVGWLEYNILRADQAKYRTLYFCPRLLRKLYSTALSVWLPDWTEWIRNLKWNFFKFFKYHP